MRAGCPARPVCPRLAALAVALVLGSISAPGLEAQAETAQGGSGGLDDMFSNGGDTVASPNGSALDSLQTSQGLTFTGNIYAMMGGAAGWASTPQVSDPRAGFGLLYGGTLTNYIYLDARPDPSFRIHGALEMAFPGFTPRMSELWFDYSMADVLFFRGGRQIIGWGNSRIFGAGDLMDNSSTALALKMYFPFGPNGLTLVTLVQDPGALGDLTGLKPEAAPRFDLVIGSFEFSQAANIQLGSVTRWASMVKTSHFGMDFFGEAFGTWVPDSMPVVSFFESAFWQTPSQRLSLYVEHFYNGSSPQKSDQRIALLGSLKLGGFTLGAQWTHAFADGSGLVMPALSFSPFNHLTVTFGLPVSYGDDGSIYAGKAPSDFNSPFYNPQNLTNPNLVSPISSWNQRYSALLKIALATTY